MSKTTPATKGDSQVTTLDDEASPAAAAAQAEVKASAVTLNVHSENLSGDRVGLTISSSEGDGGNDAVFVGLNGVGYQIPRDTLCSVPVEVAEIIKGAVVTHLVRDGKATRERQVPRYNFQISAV